MQTTQNTIWKTVPVRQFKEMIATLETAKDEGKTAMIIGNTGYTKSYSIEKFCREHKEYTYRITVSSLYKLPDIINELTEKVGVDYQLINGRILTRSMKVRLDAIVKKLIEINMMGGKPIIIFDEGENLEISVLKMLKALYDALKDHCSIVLIGTEQLLNKLLNLKKRNRDAIPQLYSRFKIGQVTLSPIVKHRDFKPFFEKYIPDEIGIQKLIIEKCDNYRELRDALEPSLNKAALLGKPLTEELFRIIHKMPA
ncbi:MAG TPA: ATP-binding protein [Segetibacter sp.]|jgi:DNA transposition AAA+ family ATPase